MYIRKNIIGLYNILLFLIINNICDVIMMWWGKKDNFDCFYWCCVEIELE